MMVEFVPTAVPGLALCQVCWATTLSTATPEHARWHEESAGKDWNEGYAEALTDIEEGAPG